MKIYIRAAKQDHAPSTIVNMLGNWLKQHMLGVTGYARSSTEYKITAMLSKQLTGLDKNSEMVVSIVTYSNSIRVNVTCDDFNEATILHTTISVKKFNDDFSTTSKKLLKKIEDSILKFFSI